MYFNTIRENKILAKISESTVYWPVNFLRAKGDNISQFSQVLKNLVHFL